MHVASVSTSSPSTHHCTLLNIFSLLICSISLSFHLSHSSVFMQLICSWSGPLHTKPKPNRKKTFLCAIDVDISGYNYFSAIFFVTVGVAIYNLSFWFDCMYASDTWHFGNMWLWSESKFWIVRQIDKQTNNVWNEVIAFAFAAVLLKLKFRSKKYVLELRYWKRIKQLRHQKSIFRSISSIFRAYWNQSYTNFISGKS